MALPDDDAIRALAVQILERPEYAEWRLDEDAWRALLRPMFSLLDTLEALRVDAPWLYWGILIALLLVAVALLVHVGWTVRAALTRSEAAEAPPPEPPPDYLARADALAAEGAYLEASRMLQWGALDALLERRVLRLARHETGAVLRERLAGTRLPRPLQQRLQALVGRLEASLFRDHGEDPELYRDWREAYGSVRGARASEVAA